MIEGTLPDIPRLLTAHAEWAACLLYVLLHRRPSRGLGALAAGALLALIVVHEIASRLPIALWTGGMLAAVAVMYGFLAWSTRLGTRDTGYLLARAFVLAELVASLTWQLHVFFFPEGAPVTTTALLVVTVYGACFVLAWRLERRLFQRGAPPEVDGRGLIAAAAIAVVTFLMSNLSFVSANTPFSGRAGLEVFYIRTLVDVAGYTALVALHAQRQEMRRLRDVQAMEQLVRSQHEEYLRSKRSIDEVNRKYHDLKHYITALRAETDPGSTAQYLDKLEESIRGYGNQVQTGHGVLDAVLATKLADAADLGVEVTCVADGEAMDFMAPLDVSALFGNALDNALRAAAAITEPEQRLVRVDVRRRDAFVVVVVENPFRETLTFEDGLPRSTKSDASDHGYGLRNMRQIAESYGGTLSVDADAQWFTLTVMLPRPA
ncbi:ATP-binding protein [Nesterenkonia suensis]